MGYYTKFNLTWEGDKDYPTKAWQELVDSVGVLKAQELKDKNLVDFEQSDRVSNLIGNFIAEDNGFQYNLNADGTSYDETKWYEHESDMKRLSKEFPEVKFTLHGEGEETGDSWYEYYLNGKVEVCKGEFVYPARTLW